MTAAALDGEASLIPAMYAFVWVPEVPILIVAASAASPTLPMSMLSSPVVRLTPAPLPTAT
jgi:hypothetical protein